MRVVGSRLIAQPFTNDEYFWPRPSAASYNGAAAGGSNWGANNPKLRDRAAQQLGPMVKYKADSASAGSGPEPRTPQQDIETWFATKPDRVADWANEYSIGVAAWAKTDYDSGKDKYDLQGDFIQAWAKDHPEIVEDWKKANPTKTDDPKPEDLATNFFVSYAAANPGKWPGVVEDEKTKEKKIAPVTSDSVISANFFDMWLQDPANASKVVDLEPVPADMVTASGAGLDPHITLRNALSVYQLDRVAAKRTAKGGDVKKTKQGIAELVRKLSFTPLSGLAGEPLVNVLELNIELDAKWPLPPLAPEVAVIPRTPSKEVPVAPAPKKVVPVVSAPMKESPVVVVPKKNAVDAEAAIRGGQPWAHRAAKDEVKKWTEADRDSGEAWMALGNANVHFGQFRPAAAAFREAAERFRADSAQKKVAETAARDAIRWAGLETRLPEILAGAVTPMSPLLWRDLGQVCRYSGRYAAAARFFAKAAEGDSKYARMAAIFAALAGFDRGSDASALSDEQRSQLRQTALVALRSHREWAIDPALAALNDSKTLAAVPVAERAQWQSLLSGEEKR